MRLRATIVIDIDAADYIEAADHQKFVGELLDTVRGRYGSVQCEIRERRPRERTTGSAANRAPSTGRLRPYARAAAS
ncbi:MAG TPA: hypothetical protein VEB20_22425 [Azospirillaceae bacterium]|nr:hypothetical protein [Azospirillaceae bacterium]